MNTNVWTLLRSPSKLYLISRCIYSLHAAYLQSSIHRKAFGQATEFRIAAETLESLIDRVEPAIREVPMGFLSLHLLTPYEAVRRQL
jgi:hypothetical protein